MEKKKKIIDMMAERLKYDKDMWGVVESKETGEVVGTDGYLTIAVGDTPDVQKKPKFLNIMYGQIFEKLKKGEYNPVDEFDKGIAERIKQHMTCPEVDIIMEDKIDGYYLTVYTDELMMHALAAVKDLKK